MTQREIKAAILAALYEVYQANAYDNVGTDYLTEKFPDTILDKLQSLGGDVGKAGAVAAVQKAIEALFG